MICFRLRGPLVSALLVVLALPGSARAQVDSVPTLDRREEARLLRRAGSREAMGDYRGAEAALRALLDRKPTSAGALFALERVLRAQGRPFEALEAVDAFLEEAPTAPEPNFLKLRLLLEADSLEALEATGRAWLSTAPASRDAYREVARTFRVAFGPEPALEVLREGRRNLEDSTALAVERGELLAQTGDLEGAAREWSLALEGEAIHLSAVLRRLLPLEEESRRLEVAEGLARRLGTEPTTLARRRAGARLAAIVGLEEHALELARSVVSELPDRARKGFLAELAREAEESASTRVALWAYREARRGMDASDEARSLDRRIARTALAVGDTAVALEARDRAARTLPEGSRERRRALAASARLQVATLDLAGARARLEAFRTEYPDAPELDGLAATLAGRFLTRGRSGDARAVLVGVEGPRSALERGYLALAGGEVESGLQDLSRAIPGLEPAAATGVIQLLALLERLEEGSGALAGRAAALAHAGRGEEAVTALEEGLSEAPRNDRPGLLALGARLAGSRGLESRAAAFRERLIRDFPGASETPEAMLRQARWHADAGGGPERARELLERLIVERPESPVVPEARRELQRLRRGAAG